VSQELLAHLQATVEGLHGVELELDVGSYVVDPATWRTLPGARAGLPEQLLICEEQDDVFLALYIAPEVIAQLGTDDPRQRLHAGNLESFCVALEGVSHFVLVAARAEVGRPVSPLELEIQAEVDKFVAAWSLLTLQGQPREQAARELLQKLFVGYELRDEVPRDEADRYVVATRVAQRFCGELASEFGRDPDDPRALHAVRRFVRQGLNEKLRAA
jgi:hypothetical protein